MVKEDTYADAQAVVQVKGHGAITSAGEAIKYIASDIQVMDNTSMGLTRGVVKPEVDFKDDKVKYKYKSNRAARRLLGMADFETEQNIWRATWMQELVERPRPQAHVLAALWGKAKCDEENVLDEEGRLAQGASPWARAFWQAAKELMLAGDREDLVELVDDRVLEPWSENIKMTSPSSTQRSSDWRTSRARGARGARGTRQTSNWKGTCAHGATCSSKTGNDWCRISSEHMAFERRCSR